MKTDWFKTYPSIDRPEKFEPIFQSWNTANKLAEPNSYSVCTTWGISKKRLYLLFVFRKRLGYPELKRAVREQADAFEAKTILIEDKAPGTQLIQELSREGMHTPDGDKIMRMNSVLSTIENGFVYLPEKPRWLGEYVHELASFPQGQASRSGRFRSRPSVPPTAC